LALGIRVSVSDAVAYADQAAETAGAGVHRASDARSLLRNAEDLMAAPRPDEHAAQSVSESTWAHAILDLLLEGRGTS
jgi:hypothetical protein